MVYFYSIVDGFRGPEKKVILNFQNDLIEIKFN